MMRQLKERLPAFAVLFILCLISYLYLDGWFDISFIVRGDSHEETVDAAENPGTETSSDSGLFSPGTEAHEPDDSPETSKKPTQNGGTDTPPASDAPEFIEIPAADSLGEDWSLSYAEWADDGWTLAEADIEIGAPGYFSSYKITETSVSYMQPGIGKPYKVVEKKTEKDAPAVSLYMGYIIVDTTKKNTVNIYDSDGSAIGSCNRTKITPAFCRDRDGRPLFTSSGAYYYIDKEKKRFTLSDYDPEKDNRGALFDYTPDYGTSKEDNRRFVSKKDVVEVLTPVEGKDDTFTVTPTVKYSAALAKSSGEEIGSYAYTRAYEFSDSHAAVVDEEGHLSYINTSGKTVIESTRRYKDTAIKRTVVEYYMEPLTNGKESIGFYFFEHGLTRARIMTVDTYYLDKGRVYVMSDEVVVINEKGERYSTPVGYDVAAYSSGVFLLRGSNGCGFMDYNGIWIVDPDLDDAEPFFEGLAVVKKDGQTALVDTDGNFVIPYGQFSYISNVSSGLLAAYDGEWHLLYKMAKD